MALLRFDDGIAAANEHGHPVATIATRLGTSYNNVRQRLIE